MNGRKKKVYSYDDENNPIKRQEGVGPLDNWERPERGARRVQLLKQERRQNLWTQMHVGLEM